MGGLRARWVMAVLLSTVACGEGSSSTGGAPGGTTGSSSSSSQGTGGDPGAGGSTGATGGTAGGGGCGDVQTDPENCGRCGHGCLGAACVGGVCQPLVVADDDGEIGGIAVNDTAVFWSSLVQNRVRRCSLPGCEGGPSLFAEGYGGVTDLQVDATSLYFGDRAAGAGAIRRCTLPDCSDGPSDMAIALGRPDHLALTDLAVYWGDTILDEFVYCELGCASFPLGVVLSSSQDQVVDLAVSQDMVLWSVSATAPGAGAIRGCYVPDCPGATQQIVSGLDAPGRLTSDGTSVLWANGGTTISRCSLPGCALGPTVVADGLAGLSAMSIHAGRLYFLASGVYVCDLPDCAAPSKIADASSSPGLIEASATVVAWAQDGSLSIVAAP